MLKRSIIFEIKRAVHETGFKLSLFLGMTISLLDIYFYYRNFYGEKDRILIQAWLGTDFQFAYNLLFYVTLPILACLPYAGSYYQDITNGYDKNVLLRIPRSTYLVAKIAAVYMTAFLAVTIPLAVNLFICAGLYRNECPDILAFTSAGVGDCNLFPIIFNENPVRYCLLYILINGLFAGALGILSMVVARWVRSTFTAIMTPFACYIIADGIMVDNTAGASNALMQMLNPLQNYVVTYKAMILTYIFMVAGSIIMIWIQGRKRDVL